MEKCSGRGLPASRKRPDRLRPAPSGGQATRRKDALRFAPGAKAAVACRIDSARTQAGPESTLIHVRAGSGSFSFFLRDVGSENPIYIPAYGTIVLPGGDDRSYDEAENDILSRKNLTKIQRIEREPETSFASASARTRRSNVPIWLGLSRDMRMFEIAEELEDTYLDEKVIKPMNSSSAVVLPETSPTHIEYRYALGRGVGVMDNIRRRLEDGVLPIYHSEMTDDDIVYRSTSFVSLAGTPLNERTVRGTHYLISDRHSAGPGIHRRTVEATGASTTARHGRQTARSAVYPDDRGKHRLGPALRMVQGAASVGRLPLRRRAGLHRLFGKPHKLHIQSGRESPA